MLIWIENAPVHGKAFDASVAAFVDKYVTCYKDESISELINYQTHRHASTCRKRGKDICRFDFPVFPMPETPILYPPDNHDAKTDCSETVTKITSLINALHKNKRTFRLKTFAPVGIRLFIIFTSCLFNI